MAEMAATMEQNMHTFKVVDNTADSLKEHARTLFHLIDKFSAHTEQDDKTHGR